MTFKLNIIKNIRLFSLIILGVFIQTELKATSFYEDHISNITIRCLGESIWDNENQTLTCSAAQSGSTSIIDSTAFQLGMVVLAATLGPTVQTYMIEPFGNFIKPLGKRLYRGTLGPHIDNGLERIYSYLPQGHLYSRADMDDLKPLLGLSLDSYWLHYIQDIDNILLQNNWFKQPVVTRLIKSLDPENGDKSSGEKN